jgi:hypothetical protein
MCAGFRSENVSAKVYLKAQDVRKIILKCVLNRFQDIDWIHLA